MLIPRSANEVSRLRPPPLFTFRETEGLRDMLGVGLPLPLLPLELSGATMCLVEGGEERGGWGGGEGVIGGLEGV